ncbi:hypothetical protein KJ596_04730 [Patescibacteria group bacterium]|nr:hypothetical protein [Patescibacteria group bacterium]MBU1868256.1 hypothetical protein [Patescibacteria group bacterium]
MPDSEGKLNELLESQKTVSANRTKAAQEIMAQEDWYMKEGKEDLLEGIDI